MEKYVCYIYKQLLVNSFITKECTDFFRLVFQAFSFNDKQSPRLNDSRSSEKG